MHPEHSNVPPISRTNTGNVRTSPIQNRRVMSVSSWFSPSSAVALTGSNIIPQMGQLPAHLAYPRVHRTCVSDTSADRG
jgi:hypothetical protein